MINIMINNLIDFPQLFSISLSKNHVKEDLKAYVLKYFVEGGPIHILTSKMKMNEFSEAKSILDQFHYESMFLCIKAFQKEYHGILEILKEAKDYTEELKNMYYSFLVQINSVYYFLMMYLKLSDPIFDAHKVLDIEEINLIYGDDDTSKQAVAKFFERTFCENSLINTCLEDYKKKEFAELKRNSHSLKGRARYAGLLRFGERAASLQKAAEIQDTEESYACLKDLVYEGKKAMVFFKENFNNSLEIPEEFFQTTKSKIEMSMIHFNGAYVSSAFDEYWKDSQIDCFYEEEASSEEKHDVLFSSAFKRINKNVDFDYKSSEMIPLSSSLQLRRKKKLKKRNEKSFLEEIFFFQN